MLLLAGLFGASTDGAGTGGAGEVAAGAGTGAVAGLAAGAGMETGATDFGFVGGGGGVAFVFASTGAGLASFLPFDPGDFVAGFVDLATFGGFVALTGFFPTLFPAAGLLAGFFLATGFGAGFLCAGFAVLTVF